MSEVYAATDDNPDVIHTEPDCHHLHRKEVWYGFDERPEGARICGDREK